MISLFSYLQSSEFFLIYLLYFLAFLFLFFICYGQKISLFFFILYYGSFSMKISLVESHKKIFSNLCFICVFIILILKLEQQYLLNCKLIKEVNTLILMCNEIEKSFGKLLAFLESLKKK